jgi:hypothetical protein
VLGGRRGVVALRGCSPQPSKQPHRRHDDDRREPEAGRARSVTPLTSPEYGSHRGHGVARRSLDRPHVAILAGSGGPERVPATAANHETQGKTWPLSEAFSRRLPTKAAFSPTKSLFSSTRPLFLGCIFKPAKSNRGRVRRLRPSFVVYLFLTAGGTCRIQL